MLITSTAYTLSAIVTIALAGLTSAAAAQSTTQRPYNAMTTNPMTTANCNGLSKTKVKASKTYAGSQFFPNSATFADVPDGSISIEVGGTTSSCVIVTVSAMGSVIGDDTTENIRVVMNPSLVAFPPEVVFKQNTPPGHVESGTHQFIFPNVTPGAKTVKVQVRSMIGGAVATGAYFFDPLIKVEYK